MRYWLSGGEWKIVAADFPDADKLLGWRQRKGNPIINAEDNIFNRLVLGEPLDLQSSNLSCSVEFPDQEMLKDYQIADVEKALSLQHHLNLNPMGLGKTPETVVYLSSAHHKKIVIVCPKIVRYQWADQLKRWGDYDGCIYEGQKTLAGSDVWIINYERLRSEQVLTLFKSCLWDAVVLDEVHKIKNRRSQQAAAAKQIPAKARIGLTGTPVLRYVDDLWSILNFLGPKYSCKSYWTFVDYFCNIKHGPYGQKIEGLTKDPFKVDLLNKALSAISIRNESISNTLGKTTETVRLPMSKAQRLLYHKERQLLLDELPENCTISNGAVLMLRLMQTTSWPGVFQPGEAGPKFEWIKELCSNNPDNSLLVFSNFEKTAEALSMYLSSYGVTTATITGKNSAKVNEFNKSRFLKGDAKILIGTLGAMGTGFDGLQAVCHTMVFVDKDWSPALMQQAEGRLDRTGQANRVSIYYLECKGTVDSYVGRVSLNKSEDIRRILQDG